MITHHYRHRVRYRECDRMGIVYHVHFLDHFEAARTELLRAHGLTYKAMEDSGIYIQVVEINIRYRRPAFYDDELDIVTMTEARSSTRLVLLNETRRIDEEDVLAVGRTELCFIDRDRGRPTRAPRQFLEAFSG